MEGVKNMSETGKLGFTDSAVSTRVVIFVGTKSAVAIINAIKNDKCFFFIFASFLYDAL